MRRTGSWLLLSLGLFCLLTTSGFSQNFFPPPPPTQPQPPQPQIRDGLPKGALARLGSTKYRVGDSILHMAFSPDGKLIAAATNSGIKMIDTRTGRLIRKMRNSTGSIRDMVFLQDGKTLAFTGYSNQVTLVNATSGSVAKTVRISNTQIRLGQLSFSADGKFFTGGNEGYGKSNPVYIYEVATGKGFGPFHAVQVNRIQSVISPDANLIASWGTYYSSIQPNQTHPSRIVQLWSRTSGKEVHKITAPNRVSRVVFSPDNKQVVLAVGQATMMICDVKTGKEIVTFAGSNGNNYLVKFSPDGKWLAAGNSTGGVQMWETKTWKRQRLPAGPRCSLRDIVFQSNGDMLACGVAGHTIRVWNVRTGKQLSPTGGHVQAIQAIAHSRDGKYITTVDRSGLLCKWDRKTGKELLRWPLNNNTTTPNTYYRSPTISYYPTSSSYYEVAFSRDGQHLATSYGSGTRLWDLQTKTSVCDFEGSQSNGCVGLTFSRNGDTMAQLSGDATLSLWDVHSGRKKVFTKLVKERVNLNRQMTKILFTPDNKRLITSLNYYDSKIRQQVYDIILWDIAQGKGVTKIHRTNTYYYCMDLSPDGKLLAAGDNQRKVSLFKVGSGTESVNLTAGRYGQITQVAFSPDNRLLAASLYDYNSHSSSIYIWEMASEQLRCEFTGHDGMISSLQFTADGKGLATGGMDTALYLWDISGKYLRQEVGTGKDREANLQAMWQALGKAQASEAFRTMGTMISETETTIALLQKEMQPAKEIPIDEDGIRKLVKELGNKRFAVRVKAEHALKKLGRQAQQFLHEAIDDPKTTQESQLRLRQLVALIEQQVSSPKDLQTRRSIEILERIGTPTARQLLSRLAGGAPSANITAQARAALERFELSKNTNPGTKTTSLK